MKKEWLTLITAPMVRRMVGLGRGRGGGSLLSAGNTHRCVNRDGRLRESHSSGLPGSHLVPQLLTGPQDAPAGADHSVAHQKVSAPSVLQGLAGRCRQHRERKRWRCGPKTSSLPAQSSGRACLIEIPTTWVLEH